FTLTAPSSMATSTSAESGSLSSPSLPFATKTPSMIWAVTPAGTGTGFFPTRDIAFPLEHAAEDLAADIGGASLAGRHDATRRRHGRQAGLLAVPDPCQHIAQGIAHRHDSPFLPLPARLDHAGDLPGRGQVPQRDARQLELAIGAARPPAQRAAIAQAHRRAVARQLGQLEARGETLLQRQLLVAGGVLQAAAAGRLL